MTATAVSATDEASRLYEEHRARILAYCVNRLGNRHDAEDAVQTTFVYAFSLLQRGVRPDSELAWLYAIAHNACRDRKRSLRRRRHVETSTDPDTIARQAPAGQSAREQLHALRAALDGLPPAQRRALLLREWQGLSYGEIADALALSHSATETLLFRARRNLATRLVHAGERVAVVLAPWPLLRRLAGGGGGKAAAATLVVGVAATVPVVQAHRPSPDHRRAPVATAGSVHALPRATAKAAPVQVANRTRRVAVAPAASPRQAITSASAATSTVVTAPATAPPSVPDSSPAAPPAPSPPETVAVELPPVAGPPLPVDVPPVPTLPTVDVPAPPALPPVTVEVPTPPAPPSLPQVKTP